MLGNVKNAMHGTYHALRPKYLQRYLSKFCYRFIHPLFGIIAASTWRHSPLASSSPPPEPPRTYRLATLGV